MGKDKKEKERQIAKLKYDVKTLKNEKLETMDRSQIVINSILKRTALLFMV